MIASPTRCKNGNSSSIAEMDAWICWPYVKERTKISTTAPNAAICPAPANDTTINATINITNATDWYNAGTAFAMNRVRNNGIRTSSINE